VSRAGGGDKVELLSADVRQRFKNKTPEQFADPVGLFGRSWTLFKFCARVSGSFAEHFILVHCIRARRVRQKFLCQ
jgi:hypothetical protein